MVKDVVVMVMVKVKVKGLVVVQVGKDFLHNHLKFDHHGFFGKERKDQKEMVELVLGLAVD